MIDGHDLPTGKIVGMNSTVAGLREAGFSGRMYRNRRLVEVDESTDAWNPDAVPGWFYEDGNVVRALTPTNSEVVQNDIRRLKQVSKDKEETDLPRLLAREKIDTANENGHTWVDDIICAYLKPNLRWLEIKLSAERDSDTPDPTNYKSDLNTFIDFLNDPGILELHRDGERATWRPLRTGTSAWHYDTDTGGTKAGTERAVTYPSGQDVNSWEAYAAIKNL